MKIDKDTYIRYDHFVDEPVFGTLALAERAHQIQLQINWYDSPDWAFAWWVFEAEEIVKAYLIWHSGLEQLLALRDKEMDDPFGNHYILREPISYAFASAWEQSEQ